MCATRSSASWSACPRASMPCPEMCTALSGRSVPENTRTRETRPTYGSTVVLTTSATSGPWGSQDSGAGGGARVAVDPGHRREVVLQRRREGTRQDLQQGVQADLRLGADRDDRVERAV